MGILRIPAIHGYGDTVPLRRGRLVHLVLEDDPHHRVIIDDVLQGETVMLLLENPRSTVQAEHDEATRAIGTWHWPEN